MGDISERGWFALAAVPFVSLGVALALVFVDPFVAGVVSAVGVLVVTPAVAVALWVSGGGDDESPSG